MENVVRMKFIFAKLFECSFSKKNYFQLLLEVWEEEGLKIYSFTVFDAKFWESFEWEEVQGRNYDLRLEIFFKEMFSWVLNKFLKFEENKKALGNFLNEF
jgi:hypothetical protein